jgi:hypothetical protein
MSRAPAALAALLAALATARLDAQPPDAAWRTIETAHFRVHTPATTVAWSARLAGRLETIRAAVVAAVGYTPDARVDVVVADPLAVANGSAWPLLGAPKMVLWATPPGAASGLGQESDWAELVAVHEYAHLAHLLRPSRSPLGAWLERTLLPLGPLALGAPRWVTEGYATLLEGRLTGSGRPASAWRAAVLRQWARQGRLPSYARLSSDPEAFLGQSMAYLAGSAFLEWLERRAGPPDPLPRLWAAATARTPRSFAAAFARVFGDEPAALWDRFAAETTAAALAAERTLAPVARQGEIWLDRQGATSALSVAPDGRRLAALVGDRRRPTRLFVWALDAAPDTSRRAAPRADAEDPAPVARPPARRRTLAVLEPEPATRLEGARFLPGEAGMLVDLVVPDRRGTRHAELGLWHPGGRHARRLTHGADVRDADPTPDGRLAFAVRWRHGFSSLVAVDLATGAVVELTEPTLDALHDRPRVAPDGRQLAWLEHRDGRWHVELAAIEAGPRLGAPRELAPADGGEALDFAWRGDGTLLYAAVARGGDLDLEALPVGAAARAHRVTRSAGAALAPAPTPDGTTLFYLALDADGLDVRRLALDAATVQPAQELETPPSATSPAATFTASALAAAPPARAYGLGRGEWRPLLGGQAGSHAGALEAGARVGDLLGRWEAIALASFGEPPAVRGGALRGTLRVLPVALGLQLARFRDGTGEHAALELEASGETRLGALEAGGGLRWGYDRRRDEGGRAQHLGMLDASVAASRPLRRGALLVEPRLEVGATRGLADSAFHARRLRASLGLATSAAALSLDWQVQRLGRGSDEPFRLGGFASSLAPLVARPARIALAALPEGAASGDRYEARRLRLAPAGSPLALLAEEHRIGDADRIRLLGAELRWRLPSIPLVGLPALEATAGVARVDGGRLGRSTRWWLGLVWPTGVRAVAPPGAGALSAPLARALDCSP